MFLLCFSYQLLSTIQVSLKQQYEKGKESLVADTDNNPLPITINRSERLK